MCSIRDFISSYSLVVSGIRIWGTDMVMRDQEQEWVTVVVSACV